ncbi:MAG: UDP-N-acetylmuramoyl-L-alanyl-D-glutamate--2,6-diaminopimelate ligase [Planctomycetes bacterium]|nr:UDP-N-acetylmuramoyl-L-alanyl-D-glutamate--2,6-diaminopimelate ligase [Planctomycetota bacterium]
MLLSELIKKAELGSVSLKGDADVARLADDSRKCGPGACFVAVRGWLDDGHKYIPQALSAGCVAVVCEDASAVPAGSNVAIAVVDDTHRALGRLAQAILDWPARKLSLVGVTGTNGKSTVTHLIQAVLAEVGHKPALLGTITYETGRRSIPAPNTTPGPLTLAEVTAEMVQAGRTHLVMEVSSHALHQRRIEGLDFQIAVFTNLTGDHLDYHRTMDEYRSVKRTLFANLSPKATAIVNRDDQTSDFMTESIAAKSIWYGLSPLADLRGRIDQIDISGSRFDLIFGGRNISVSTPLIGRHNVYNCLAAIGACAALGADMDKIVAGIGKVARVPGRLERVASAAPFQVFVDYAHTDDALENVLKSLRGIASGGRIIAVFGCGGDRDRTKRPRMGKVAEKFADLMVITSDNPRSEDPQGIINEIIAGLSEQGRSRADIQPDRRQAIARAVELAKPGDVVLIAGKGHETYQLVAGKKHDFDDVQIARQTVDRLDGGK